MYDVALPHYPQPTFLLEALVRYYNFLLLQGPTQVASPLKFYKLKALLPCLSIAASVFEDYLHPFRFKKNPGSLMLTHCSVFQRIPIVPQNIRVRTI